MRNGGSECVGLGAVKGDAGMKTEPGDLGASDLIWGESVIDAKAQQSNTIRDKPGASRS